jgi:hypothetical protein
MDMTMSSIRPNRVEVVTNVQRRRRWTPEQKLEIVKQTNEPGSSVSLVARQHGLTGSETISCAKQLCLKSVITPVITTQSNGMSESFVMTLKRDYAELAKRPALSSVNLDNAIWS